MELTSVYAPSIIAQMEKWRDGHEDLSTDFLLTSSEERYVNLIDCAFSAVCVGWWGLGLLPLAPVARSLHSTALRTSTTFFGGEHHEIENEEGGRE